MQILRYVKIKYYKLHISLLNVNVPIHMQINLSAIILQAQIELSPFRLLSDKAKQMTPIGDVDTVFYYKIKWLFLII